MKANSLKQKLTKGNKLLIDEMFYSLQTEGPLAGRPAYFVRLFGCNLNCAFCDTPQKKATKMKVKAIMTKILKENVGYLVVITGGEPFLQNIQPLITAIIRAGLTVQIETNGILEVPEIPWLPQSVFVVVSPKTKDISKEIAARALAFKYVVSKDNINPRDGLPKGLYRPDKKDLGKIMVSPMWTDNEETTQANIDTAVMVCKTFGYYLSLQYHKQIGIK